MNLDTTLFSSVNHHADVCAEETTQNQRIENNTKTTYKTDIGEVIADMGIIIMIVGLLFGGSILSACFA